MDIIVHDFPRFAAVRPAKACSQYSSIFFCLGVPGRFMLYALFGKGLFSDKLKSR